MECNKSFSILMPVCVKVMKDPNKQNILELKTLIPNVFSKDLMENENDALQAYVMFPLELHLKTGKNRLEVRRYLIDCMQELIQGMHFTSLNKLLNLYTVLFIQIFDKDREGFVADVSEEMKCSVLDCCALLLARASHDTLLELYDRKNFRKLSQGFFMCVHMTHTERSREVRLSAVKGIMALAQLHSDKNKMNSDVQQKVRDNIMFLLPGIVHGLMKSWTGDEKQGHQITLMSLRAWSEVIALVMEDEDTEEGFEGVTYKLCLNPPSDNGGHFDATSVLDKNLLLCEDSESFDRSSRTPEWLRAAALKLGPHFTRLCDLQGHPHRLVRLELVASCDRILSRCATNLSQSSISLLEILVVLSEDGDGEVARAASQSLVVLSRGQYGTILDTLEANLDDILTRLPRLVRSSDAPGQMAALRLLSGHLRLARPLSAAQAPRLVLALLHVAQLDPSRVSLLDDPRSLDWEGTGRTAVYLTSTHFVHLEDRDVLNKFREICATLARDNTLDVLSNQLLDTFRSIPLHRKEAAFLLNEVLGNCHADSQKSLGIVKNTLDTYLDPQVWYVATSTEEDEGLSGAQLRDNLSLACLLVEGVGKMAAALGPAFDRFLMRTLYPVLERAGNTQEALARAGTYSASAMARAGGHTDVAGLVHANADYFAHHVTARLRRVEHNPGVLDVLDVVMRHCCLDVLPCMRDIVNDVLLQSCDEFHDVRSLAFLRVFRTFVVCTQRWCEDSVPKEARTPNPPPTPATRLVRNMADIRESLLERQRSKSRLQELLDSDNEIPEEGVPECPSVEQEDEGEDKKSVPGHIQMTAAILKKCLNFLPTNKPHQQLLVLDTLTEGVQVLRHYEDELLPVVHLIWSPLVGRFRLGVEPTLLGRSFTLLCALADTARDFIQSRTLKDVLPSILRFLSVSARDSTGKDSGSAYRFTQQFKLQLRLLDGLGPLSLHLGLVDRQLDDVLFAVLPYLAARQPLALQEGCVRLFTCVALHNPDAVWLKMMSIVDPREVLPPPERYLVANHVTNPKLKDNAEKILKFLRENVTRLL